MERSRLQQARTLAFRRQDYAEVAQIDAKLAELQASAPVREEGAADVLARVNERNRRLNQEQVRKAERAEMERKRRDKLLRAGAAATPTGGALDAAARLRAKMLGAGTSRSVFVFVVWCVAFGGWLVDELVVSVGLALLNLALPFLQAWHSRNPWCWRVDAALSFARGDTGEGCSQRQWGRQLRGESAPERRDRSWRLLDEGEGSVQICYPSWLFVVGHGDCYNALYCRSCTSSIISATVFLEAGLFDVPSRSSQRAEMGLGESSMCPYIPCIMRTDWLLVIVSLAPHWHYHDVCGAHETIARPRF